MSEICRLRDIKRGERFRFGDGPEYKRVFFETMNFSNVSTYDPKNEILAVKMNGGDEGSIVKIPYGHKVEKVDVEKMSDSLYMKTP